MTKVCSAINRIIVAIMALTLAIAGCTTGRSFAGTDGTVADPEEYAVMEAALKRHTSTLGWSIDEKSLQKQLSSSAVAFLKKPQPPEYAGMGLDDAIVEDFNMKNKVSHILSGAFVGPKNAYMFRKSPDAGTWKIALSRPGFDAARKRAVIMLRDTYIKPYQAFVQEEYFMLLERSAGGWLVKGIVKSGFRYS
jgi:hypothetical protein